MPDGSGNSKLTGKSCGPDADLFTVNNNYYKNVGLLILLWGLLTDSLAGDKLEAKRTSVS